MAKRFFILWIVGLISIVPYGIYYLLFEATRDQYALVSVLVLFWIFGFWGIAGPLISVLKLHNIMRSLEKTRSREDVKKLLQRRDLQDTLIDTIASDNHIPKFIASRVYHKFMTQLSESSKIPDKPS